MIILITGLSHTGKTNEPLHEEGARFLPEWDGEQSKNKSLTSDLSFTIMGDRKVTFFFDGG